MHVARTFLVAVLTVVVILSGVLVAAPVTLARAATPLYPDLQTLKPDGLEYAHVLINGTTHLVLRFSTTVWNGGQGPLELRGSTGTTNTVKVSQRIYNSDGTYSDVFVGNFGFDPATNHWAFNNFYRYELWTQAAYNRWLATGHGQPRTAAKMGCCLSDDTQVQSLPNSPPSKVYTSCGPTVQGLSVGWGDIYSQYFNGNWIDLGSQRLRNGNYVLRAVADPTHVLHESDSSNNAGVRFFTVRGSQITQTG